MEEIIKNILYYTAIITGSISLILLFLCALYRVLCIFLDYCKNANIIRECLMIYIKQKRPDLKIRPEDIDFSKQRINLKHKENEKWKK